MTLTVAVPVPDKIAPEILEMAQRLSSEFPGQWTEGPELLVELALVDAAQVEAQREAVDRALQRSTNAQQGFHVTLAGVQAQTVRGEACAVVPVTENAGMLQSLAFSLDRRMPAGVTIVTEEPWRPRLVLARFASKPSDDQKLRLQAAGFGKSWDLTVKVVGLYAAAGQEPALLGKLPASGV